MNNSHMTKIAKIVKSNSHVDYIGRVIDRLDADEPPGADDYGFAQFVSLPLAEEFEVFGVIYDTQLVNPEYGQFGPRLSPAADLAILSPDYLNEQGVLVGILLLGWREGAKRSMSVPRRVIPVGQECTAWTRRRSANFIAWAATARRRRLACIIIRRSWRTPERSPSRSSKRSSNNSTPFARRMRDSVFVCSNVRSPGNARSAACVFKRDK
jgi:hypothetical protein